MKRKWPKILIFLLEDENSKMNMSELFSNWITFSESFCWGYFFQRKFPQSIFQRIITKYFFRELLLLKFTEKCYKVFFERIICKWKFRELLQGIFPGNYCYWNLQRNNSYDFSKGCFTKNCYKEIFISIFLWKDYL